MRSEGAVSCPRTPFGHFEECLEGSAESDLSDLFGADRSGVESVAQECSEVAAIGVDCVQVDECLQWRGDGHAISDDPLARVETI